MFSIDGESPTKLRRTPSRLLLFEIEGRTETIRLYDGAHGHNEMHRYTRSAGKQPGTPLHRGTLGEGMRAAIGEIKSGYREMIEGWQGQLPATHNLPPRR